MNCEQVEERLSAYLDNVLAPAERQAVTSHLQLCPSCMLFLTEFRQNDMLLAQLPRIKHSSTLHTRIFLSPEMQEIIATNEGQTALADSWSRPFVARDISPLPSLPEVYSREVQTDEVSPGSITRRLYRLPSSVPNPSKRSSAPRRIAVTMIVVLILITASLTALSLHHQPTTAGIAGAITPPAAGPGAAYASPLSAGTRFVFLRDQALWSTLVDESSQQPERLTPTNVAVATTWVVGPTMAGHTAGDIVAYIDLHTATVHTIRSDGQQDMSVEQPLVKAGTSLAPFWKTTTGGTILTSLAWSADTNMLAFVGDPLGNGQTKLYLYQRESGRTQTLSTGLNGSVSNPSWSPDGSRVAFEVTRAGAVSIFDYNIQTQEILNLTNLVDSEGSSAQHILTLGWSPSASEPAVTWSLGSIGSISSLWIHRVGNDGTFYPQLLLSGDYIQAIYSQSGDNGSGSWLLISQVLGQTGDIGRIDLTPGAGLVPLSQGKQVSFASWSPDGSFVFYLDGQMDGTGNGYVVNVTSQDTRLLAHTVALNPAPAWSEMQDQLAYNVGDGVAIFNPQNNNNATQLKLHGPVVGFSWSPGAANQLVVVFAKQAAGIYLVNTRRNISQKLDPLSTTSQIQWTQIP